MSDKFVIFEASSSTTSIDLKELLHEVDINYDDEFFRATESLKNFYAAIMKQDIYYSRIILLDESEIKKLDNSKLEIAGIADPNKLMIVCETYKFNMRNETSHIQRKFRDFRQRSTENT